VAASPEGRQPPVSIRGPLPKPWASLYPLDLAKAVGWLIDLVLSKRRGH
jgi:hypothetical protein